MPERSFWSFDLHQQVNQFIAIALLASICLWVVLYYLINRAQAFANDYVAASTGADYTLEPLKKSE